MLANPLVAGLILVCIFAVIHVALMMAAPAFSMSHAGIFLGVFVAGLVSSAVSG